MKADHRKELKSNVLSEYLEKFYESLKAGPQSKSTTAWVLLAVAVGVVAAWFYFRHTAPLPWTDLQNTDDTKLQTLAEKYRGTPLARVARFQQARDLLARGQLALAAEPKRAVEDLDRASSLYQDLAIDCNDDPILRDEALLGVATAEEARGNLEQAKEYYEKLAKAAPKSDWGKMADDRAKDLANELQAGSGPEIDFYKRFQQQLAKRPALDRSP
jgi:tetratricopeptide (TPR) repeat protein